MPLDFDDELIELCRRVGPFTMTSSERLHALWQAVRHIVKHHIPGSIVECGVWKGGSMMAAALTLIALNEKSRDVYLFDTFAGMPEPDDGDVDHHGTKAADLMSNAIIVARSGEDEVRRNLATTGYPPERLHFVSGDVERTIPDQAPGQIALLRLDTDWYKSTRHELIHLYPRLERGGILILDDYGHWQGARRAVDEYFDQEKIPIFLGRLDYTGRIAVKP